MWIERELRKGGAGRSKVTMEERGQRKWQKQKGVTLDKDAAGAKLSTFACTLIFY